MLAKTEKVQQLLKAYKETKAQLAATRALLALSMMTVFILAAFLCKAKLDYKRDIPVLIGDVELEHITDNTYQIIPELPDNLKVEQITVK